MAKIGTMTRSDGGYSMRGQLTTLHAHFQFGLRPAEKARESSPTHEIWAKGSHGHMANVGVAWERTIKRGNQSGQSMFSMLIDDPDIPEISASAFPDGEGWTIQTERKRRSADQPEESGQKNGEAVTGDLDDGVPF